MSKAQCNLKEAQLQEMLSELAQTANAECQFSQRNSKLNAERFVQTLVLGWLSAGDASLNALAQKASQLGIVVSASALHERMNASAVELLGRVLVSALRRAGIQQRLALPHLSQFSAIYVTDSTQVALPPTLRVEFAGNSGNAMAKLHITLDYLTGQWVGLEISAGKCPDVNSGAVLQHAQSASLNLFDLGYFKQDHLLKIQQQAAYFISRYQSQTDLYEPNSFQGFDLVAWLQTLTVAEAQRAVSLGSRAHLGVWLVARRLTPAAAAARRRKAHKKYKKGRKTCSKRYLYLLGWDILVTNLSPDDWSLEQIFALYPIRTQIEWLFRIWKSQLRVNYLGNWRNERVWCQLYAHLIGALLCQRLCGDWLWREQQEFSLAKCVRLVQAQLSGLLDCVAHHWQGLSSWLRHLEDLFRAFGRKTKRRTTPSTLQNLILVGLS